MANRVLVVATHNLGKRREFHQLLRHLSLDLLDLTGFPNAPTVAEHGDTYQANARLKAISAAQTTGRPALADDSGLEVDALGGAPGVRSARFAGPDQADQDNIRLLLERLRDVSDQQRTARFRCVIVVAHPDGRELCAEGTCAGVITREVRGANGFGYDPVFLHPATGSTFGEMSAERKLQASHRAAACRQLERNLLEFIRR